MSTCVATSVDVALLGCGTVGSALARLATPDAAGHLPLRLTGALVRDLARDRDRRALPALTLDPHSLLDRSPDVVVELLGGLEPARSLVLEALRRGIPVVTANKSLLAHHGAELRAAAHAAGTPLLYEAAVLAGVPFLGTLARRPHAAAVHGIAGIVNGTTNFVLGRCAEGARLDAAVREAQTRGYAEPDPASDLDGIDAAEKLAVLLQHFAARDLCPGGLEVRGIRALSHVQIRQAQELGGIVKPVVAASWRDGVQAFAGPAFVPTAHPLARVDGVDNAVLLEGPRGRLFFQGPGAGPDATAATVLDDVAEIAAGLARPPARSVKSAHVTAPDTGWMLTLEAARLPSPVDVADLLAAHGLYVHRATTTCARDAREHRSLLLHEAPRPRVERAVAAVQAAAGCSVSILRALEVTP